MLSHPPWHSCKYLNISTTAPRLRLTKASKAEPKADPAPLVWQTSPVVGRERREPTLNPEQVLDKGQHLFSRNLAINQ